MVLSLYAALCLAGVRAQDLDVQLSQCATELGLARSTLGVRVDRPEDRVPVRVKGDRAAVLVKVPAQRFEVGLRTLTSHEAQLHEPARGIVDEHQQGAGIGAVLEPAMVRAVDLHKLTIALATKPWLVERPALLA